MNYDVKDCDKIDSAFRSQVKLISKSKETRDEGDGHQRLLVPYWQTNKNRKRRRREGSVWEKGGGRGQCKTRRFIKIPVHGIYKKQRHWPLMWWVICFWLLVLQTTAMMMGMRTIRITTRTTRMWERENGNDNDNDVGIVAGHGN